MNPFNISIHMVSSLDGYIAKKDNSVSWFETTDNYENGMELPDVTAFLKTIDCYLMGAYTYEHALELSKNYGWPYGETPTIVLTHRNLPLLKPNIQTYAGDLRVLVEEKLKPHYKNVWIAGGAKLANEFLQQNLANEIRLTILPILLGDGIPFWNITDRERGLHLKGTTAYKNGLVELCYGIK